MQPKPAPTQFQGQQQVNLDENDVQKKYWAAAGVRGAALGEVPAAQVHTYVFMCV